MEKYQLVIHRYYKKVEVYEVEAVSQAVAKLMAYTPENLPDCKESGLSDEPVPLTILGEVFVGPVQ